MFVIDASVHVADMRPSEPHHGEARALLDYLRGDDDPVYAPIVVLAEVAGAIARAVPVAPTWHDG